MALGEAPHRWRASAIMTGAAVAMSAFVLLLLRRRRKTEKTASAETDKQSEENREAVVKDSSACNYTEVLLNAVATLNVEFDSKVKTSLRRGVPDDDSFLSLMEALAEPPRHVSLRMVTAGSASLDEASELLQATLGCQWRIRRLEELAPPLCWMRCQEARVVCHVSEGSDGADRYRGESYRNEFNTDLFSPLASQDEPVADLLVDALCAMAVLRGAEPFCPGILAASPCCAFGLPARVWVAPESEDTLRRGSVVETPRDTWKLVAVGKIAVANRATIFQDNAHGIAVHELRRNGPPLPSMNAITTSAVLSGRVFVQNLPSLSAPLALSPHPGERVLDMCAAPGGKTTYLAWLMKDTGIVVAVDRSATKVRRIAALCEQHGLRSVRCVRADATKLCRTGAAEETQTLDESWPCKMPWTSEAEAALVDAIAEHGATLRRGHKRICKAVIAAIGRDKMTREMVEERLKRGDPRSSTTGASNDKLDIASKVHFDLDAPPFPEGCFDRILVDASCSAMGQKPLLRWGKTYADVQDHAGYQRQFLKTAGRLVRSGGTVVFSTCTLMPEENEENVRWALDDLPFVLEDAREGILNGPSDALAGWAGCGLDEEERFKVLRFSPTDWDLGFFTAKFKKM